MNGIISVVTVSLCDFNNYVPLNMEFPFIDGFSDWVVVDDDSDLSCWHRLLGDQRRAGVIPPQTFWAATLTVKVLRRQRANTTWPRKQDKDTHKRHLQTAQWNQSPENIAGALFLQQ